jgi:integrase
MEGFGPLDLSSNLSRATIIKPRSTCDQLVTQYLFHLRYAGYKPKTIKGYVQIIKYFSKHGDLYNPDEIKSLITSQGWSEARKRNSIYAYRHFVKMIGLAWVEPRYHAESKLPFLPYEKEVDSLISALSPTLSTLTRTLKETGARVGEAIQIQIRDIDFENCTIKINGVEKNGLPRMVKVTEGLLAMITRHGSKPNLFRGNCETYRRRFEVQRRRIAEKTQNPRIDYITFHTFRHFFATKLYHQTKDILFVKKQLGHKNIQNTLIYTHLVDFGEENAFTVRIASSIEEFTKLLESGFEYVSDYEGKKILRKRK